MTFLVKFRTLASAELQKVQLEPCLSTPSSVERKSTVQRLEDRTLFYIQEKMPDKEQSHKVYNQTNALTNQNILKKLAMGQETLQAPFYQGAQVEACNSLLS